MAKKGFTAPSWAVNTIQLLADLVKDQAATLKAKFDLASLNILNYVLNFIVELQDETEGNSGSNTIGHGSVSTSSDNVGDTLEENRLIIDDNTSRLTTEEGALTTHKSSGDHDGRYYTETELDAGQLDNRYFTEAEIAALTGSNLMGHTSANVVAEKVGLALEEIAVIAKGASPTSNVFSVLDYGLTGLGIANDATALNTLITNIGSTEATILFPSLMTSEAVYLISTNVVFPENINVVFNQGATLKVSNTFSVTGTNTKLTAGLYQIFDLSLGGVVGGSWDKKEIFPQWFGAKVDGTDSSTAIQQAIDFMSFNQVLVFSASDFTINSKIQFTGTNRKIICKGRIIWKGGATGPAVEFGDGGITTTEGWKVYDLFVASDTEDVDVLVKFNYANRNVLYNMQLTTPTETSTSGNLIQLTESVINSFFGLRLKHGFNGVSLENNSNGCYFYDTIAEDQTGSSVIVPLGNTINSVKFYGGVFESSLEGFRFDNPVYSFFLDGIYFEANNIHIIYDSAGAAYSRITNCRFISPLNGNGHSIQADQPVNIIAENNEFLSTYQIQINDSACKYISKFNNNLGGASGEAAIDDTTGNAYYTVTTISGQGFEDLNGQGLRMDGIPVKPSESGNTATIAGGGGTLPIVFATPFQYVPGVSVTHLAGTSRNLPFTITGLTANGFTIINHASGATAASWIAI